MSAKVLVLGARGLLGRSLVRQLDLRGYDTVEHARTGNVDVTADLAEESAVGEVLETIIPDVIVNLAALTNVDECEKNPNRAYLSNVRIVENLVRWMTQNDRFIHLIQISTDQVYDGVGVHTEHDIALSNYYAFSKYAGELAAARIPSTVLRTNFFGPSECPGKQSFSDWIVEALTYAKPITVFDDVCFSPLSIQRVAELVELLVRKRPKGVFNAGSRGGMSKADFAYRLGEVLGLPTTPLTRGSSRDARLIAYRPKDMRMDSSSLEDFLQVEMPSLSEEIASMKPAYRTDDE